MTQSDKNHYPIGQLGVPWNDTHKQQWLAKQTIKRSYSDEVLNTLSCLGDGFKQHHYGSLAFDEKRYPLYAYTSVNWQADKPVVLISGGVHGYETSGVQGAIAFLLHHADDYRAHYNFIVAPCVSPWAYETINRWNPQAIDPNRSFCIDSLAQESALLMAFVSRFIDTQAPTSKILAHMDLHETTNTDNTEFRPALAARDGQTMHDWEIPDGFYTVANTAQPQAAFQKAIIDSVRQVTHIAEADENGKIIGADVISPGVICYDKRALFLCGGFTDAPYVTTTEVYPDSKKATPQICVQAQIAAITGALDFLLKIQ